MGGRTSDLDRSLHRSQDVVSTADVIEPQGRTARSDLVFHLYAGSANRRESFAEYFLSEWLEFPRDQRPEKWAAVPGGAKRVESASLDEIVSAWQEAPLRFSRAARQRVLFRQYTLEASDGNPFPREVSAWFAKSGGTDVARNFSMLAAKYFEPAFAVLTTREDFHRKHCRDGGAADCQGFGTGECFSGHRVCVTIPGIYWITYFGPPVSGWIREQRLRSIPLGRVEPLGNGYVLTAYDSPRLIGSDDALRRERAIMRHLGEQRFFRRNEKSRRLGRYGSRTQRYAEKNRTNPTRGEIQLGRILDKLNGGSLRGQYICQWAFGGKWILDVYIPHLRLGFEVDGGYHDEPDQREKDRLKARDCGDRGITLIRFTNDEIERCNRDVLAKIRRAIAAAAMKPRRY